MALMSAWRRVLDRIGNEAGLCLPLAMAAGAAMVDPAALWQGGGYEARAWALAAAAILTGSVWMLAVYLLVEVAARAARPAWSGVASASGGLAAGMMAVATFVAVGASLRSGLPAFAPTLVAFSACAAAPLLLLCRLSLVRGGLVTAGREARRSGSSSRTA